MSPISVRKLMTCLRISAIHCVTNTTDEVAEGLELVEKICLAAQKESPDYDCNRIYARLHEEG